MEWYFTLTSEEYGTEEFSGYNSQAEAGIARVKAKAAELNDEIEREYSEPYAKA